ncbi:MAG: hypothetical protein ACXVW0_12395 [Nocardioides sp.]
MDLPANKQIKDLFEGLLGRDVALEETAPQEPDSVPRPMTAIYVDDSNKMSSIAVMDFNLTAWTGAALALVPKGGAEAAIEDRDIPDSLLDNASEILNVLAAPIGDASGVHQRLLNTYSPHETVPREVLEWTAQPGMRMDVKLDVKGYGEGVLSVISTQFMPA